jgi:hypothetical protein
MRIGRSDFAVTVGDGIGVAGGAVGVNVAVSVGALVDVAVKVGVCGGSVGNGVRVDVLVAVGITVGVSVAGRAGSGVAVGVSVGSAVGDGVLVDVLVNVGSTVGVWVLVARIVGVGVGGSGAWALLPFNATRALTTIPNRLIAPSVPNCLVTAIRPIKYASNPMVITYRIIIGIGGIPHCLICLQFILYTLHTLAMARCLGCIPK